MRVLTITMLMVALCAALVAADSMQSNRLNYFNASDTVVNHTLSYTATSNPNVTMVIPSPFNFSTVNDCGGEPKCSCNSTTRIATCTGLVDGETVSVVIQPKSFTAAEYTTHAAQGNSTNLVGGNLQTVSDVNFLRIKEDEIFHTLVEFGRGRGNYFFDSLGRSTSASQGTGYPYVPNGTRFELTYLHKVFNVKQYFGLATALAGNATWTCTYPNNTVVRNHLATSVSRGGIFNVSYKIPEIGGSFERQGFLSQQFDQAESVSVGNSFTVNCTDLTYELNQAGGNISVGVDDIVLTFRDTAPFNISATTTTSAVGNGTQLVDIVYSITNLEVYPVDDVVVEIAAPRFATFVNARAEIFGESKDKYIFERTRIPAGATETITLTARFVTGDQAAGVTSVNLTGQNVVEFIPPWEVNAYNPVQSVQSLHTDSTLSVNLNLNVSVVDLLDTIDVINSTVATNNEFLQFINSTVSQINTTVNSIQTTVLTINTTTVEIQDTVVEINNTIRVINNSIISINDTVVSINGTLTSRTAELNNTLNALNLTAEGIEGTVNNISAFVEDINDTTGLPSIDVTGTLFVPTNLIIVDAIFSDKNKQPIAGAQCNISLMDETFTLLEENATMREQQIAGIPHYTFNRSNVSVLGGSTTGAFFGHVRCNQPGKSPTFVETDFQVQRLGSANEAKLDEIIARVRRQREFNEELIFLVTDSFGLRQEAQQDALQGRNDDAIQKLTKANEQLTQVAERIAGARERTLSSTATPAAEPANAEEVDWSVGETSHLWATIVVLAALLIYVWKREHVHEPEF